MRQRQISQIFAAAALLLTGIVLNSKGHSADEYFEEESVNGTVDCGTYAIDGYSSYLIKSKDGMTSCVWIFLGTNDCFPMITCSRFLITPSDSCLQHYLALSDGSADVGLRFCGVDKPYYATSQTSILKVTLSITSDYGASLFECKVSCAKPHLTYNGYGFGYNYDQSYPPNLIPTTPLKVVDCDCGVKGPLSNIYKEAHRTSSSTDHSQATIKIIGGEAVKEGEYHIFAPVIVPKYGFPFCGGSLISDSCVLTAAHCVISSRTGEVRSLQNTQVFLNPFDLKNVNMTESPRVNLSKIIPHPLYNRFTKDFDAAILVLAEPVKLIASSFTDFLSQPQFRTVCLPPPKTFDDFAGKNATVIGFGRTTEDGTTLSTTLLKVTVPVIPNDKCHEMYSRGQPPLNISSNMLCASRLNADACQGDSGGPLMIEVYQRVMQIGVVSFGVGCGREEFPGTYSRLTELNDWIRMTCRKSTWCRDLEVHKNYHKIFYDE